MIDLLLLCLSRGIDHSILVAKSHLEILALIRERNLRVQRLQVVIDRFSVLIFVQ